MNSFGRIFRVHLFGESHGPAVGVVVDGCPAGLPLAESDLMPDLDRRRAGEPGTTARREADHPAILSGVHNGRTTGAPILIRFENTDVDSSAYADLADTPRPGHADWTARAKFGGFQDSRGSGHFSGRVTVALVAAGAVARKLVAPAEVRATLLEAGGDGDVERAVAAAQADQDSVGGLIECRATGLPPGLGEPFFDSMESLVSHAVFSIPAVKGVEFGAGFGAARMRGSQCNDPFLDAEGRTASNHAGGVAGGITNGNELVFRVAVKPTSSIARPQQTVRLSTGQPHVLRMEGRHDACIALRMPVIVEAAALLVVADALLLEQCLPRVWPD